MSEMTRATGKKQTKLMNKFTSPTGEVSQATQDKLVNKIVMKHKRHAAKATLKLLGKRRIEKLHSLPGYDELEVGMVYIQKDESRVALIGHPLWFVVDQNGSTSIEFPFGYDTKKEARQAIADAGLVEGGSL
jgi:hypothetical protein